MSAISSVNGAHFLNIAYLLFSSSCIASGVAPAPAAVMVPLTSMYVSLKSHKFDFNVVVLNLV